MPVIIRSWAAVISASLKPAGASSGGRAATAAVAASVCRPGAASAAAPPPAVVAAAGAEAGAAVLSAAGGGCVRATAGAGGAAAGALQAMKTSIRAAAPTMPAKAFIRRRFPSRQPLGHDAGEGHPQREIARVFNFDTSTGLIVWLQ